MPTPHRPYSYNCVDKSILLPYFKDYYVTLYFKLIPKWLTANFITLLSSFAMWLMLLFSITRAATNPLWYGGVFVFLIHFYVVGDHLDGMQAKNTKTSSPLGEFLDHYFDLYNMAITVTACFSLFEVESTLLYLMMLWLSYIAFGATMMEEKERGELYFGPIGSLEGVVLAVIFFGSCAFPSGLAFWNAPLFGEYPRYMLFIVLFGLACVGTFFDILIRLKYIPKQFNVFALLSLALTILIYNFDVSRVGAWFFLAFYCGDYICRVMKSYLLHSDHPYPDLIAGIAILILLVHSYFPFIPKPFDLYFLRVIFVYMGIKNIISFIQTFSGMKKHWNWINP
ncbi:MAG: phosphatidylglycerophosphate synthase [bacterium]|jgi:phosphatidylglycerophosphate synthase